MLSYGVLRYYEKNGLENAGTGEKELGFVSLRNCDVKNLVMGRAADEECRLQVFDVSSKAEVLLMETEHLDEKNMWYDMIRQHCRYATEFNSA